MSARKFDWIQSKQDCPDYEPVSLEVFKYQKVPAPKIMAEPNKNHLRLMKRFY